MKNKTQEQRSPNFCQIKSFQDQKGFTTPYQRPNELFQDMAMIQLAYKHDIKSITDYSEVAFRANLLVEPNLLKAINIFYGVHQLADYTSGVMIDICKEF